MPRIGEMIESKFLKKEDVGDGRLLTISRVKQHNVAMQGAEEEMKWCAEFDEIDKPLVLNSTNLHLLETALGSDDSDDWLGKAIVVYNDANVSFGGKVVGGVRVDANRTKRYHAKLEKEALGTVTAAKQSAKLAEPQPSHFDDLDSDVPF